MNVNVDFEKAPRKIKLHVVSNLKRYPKPIINLPKEVLKYFQKGDEFFVFFNNKMIILSTEEQISLGSSEFSEKDIELYQLLLKLFIKVFQNPELNKKLKRFEETREILNLLE